MHLNFSFLQFLPNIFVLKGGGFFFLAISVRYDADFMNILVSLFRKRSENWSHFWPQLLVPAADNIIRIHKTNSRDDVEIILIFLTHYDCRRQTLIDVPFP